MSPRFPFAHAAVAVDAAVQRILGHASAAMTMDPYGHLIDHNLWDSAKPVGGIRAGRGSGGGADEDEKQA